MNPHEVFIHIHQDCFAGTGAIVRLPQWQWSKPDGYGKISQCITTTKHSKAKTVCIFLGIYCTLDTVHSEHKMQKVSSMAWQTWWMYLKSFFYATMWRQSVDNIFNYNNPHLSDCIIFEFIFAFAQHVNAETMTMSMKYRSTTYLINHKAGSMLHAR